MKKTPLFSVLGALGLMTSANAAMLFTVNDANSFTLQIVGGATFDGANTDGLVWGTVSGPVATVGAVADSFTHDAPVVNYTQFAISYTGSTVNSVKISPALFSDPSNVTAGSLTATGVTEIDLTTMDFSGLNGVGLTVGTGTGDTTFAVPEASTALMAVFGGLMFVGRRRRRA